MVTMEVVPQAEKYFLAIMFIWPLPVILGIIHWVLFFVAYEEIDLSKMENSADSLHYFAEEW